jgi:hypothetical protein
MATESGAELDVDSAGTVTSSCEAALASETAEVTAAGCADSFASDRTAVTTTAEPTTNTTAETTETATRIRMLGCPFSLLSA